MVEKKTSIATMLILLLLSNCTQDVVTPISTQETTVPHRMVYATCWGIWTANQDGSEIVNLISQKELGHLLCPVGLSEDGERVAYWADDEDNVGLWVSDIDTWDPHLVSDNWPSGFEPAGVRWGTNPSLVFVAGYGEGQGLYVVDLDTGQRERWNKLCLSVGVSPRTHQLAGWDIHLYSSGNSAVEVVEKDGLHWKFSGSLPSNLVSFGCDMYAFPALNIERDPWCWSPNYDQIAVREFVGAWQRLTIVGVPENISGDLIVDKFQTPDGVSSCAWSPQDQYIAFHSTCTNRNKHCVFVLDLHSREIVWENEGHEPLYWNPDGTKLFFTIDRQISPDYSRGEPPVGVWSLDLATLETSRILATPVEAFAWRTALTQEDGITP
jgi:hypothetical protein